MTSELTAVSLMARRAVESQDWATVARCAREILLRQQSSPEGHFLNGLVEKASGRPVKALQAFEQALALDADRYDAAVEVANQYSFARRNGEAAELLGRYSEKLHNSPVYLNLAGTVYTEIGMPQEAWLLFKKATELQPQVDLFQANLAACDV